MRYLLLALLIALLLVGCAEQQTDVIENYSRSTKTTDTPAVIDWGKVYKRIIRVDTLEFDTVINRYINETPKYIIYKNHVYFNDNYQARQRIDSISGGLGITVDGYAADTCRTHINFH